MPFVFFAQSCSLAQYFSILFVAREVFEIKIKIATFHMKTSKRIIGKNSCCSSNRVACEILMA